MRVRGDGLSDSLARSELPVVHAGDATPDLQRLTVDLGAEHVGEVACGAAPVRRVVYVDARAGSGELRTGRQPARDVDVLERLEGENHELELDSIATAVGVVDEGLHPKGAADLFSAGVDIDAKQRACATAVHGQPLP